MSQNIFTDIDPGSVGGTQLAGYLNNFKKAMLSGMSGTSRPAEVTTGGFWVSTADAGDDILRFMFYGGTEIGDVEIFNVNTDNGQVSVSGVAGQTYIVAEDYTEEQDFPDNEPEGDNFTLGSIAISEAGEYEIGGFVLLRLSGSAKLLGYFEVQVGGVALSAIRSTPMFHQWWNGSSMVDYPGVIFLPIPLPLRRVEVPSPVTAQLQISWTGFSGSDDPYSAGGVLVDGWQIFAKKVG